MSKAEGAREAAGRLERNRPRRRRVKAVDLLVLRERGV